MRIVLLGTGGAFPTKDRNVSSAALQLEGETFLFDCGEGTQRQLLHTSISFMKITRIYISHLHGDHFFGLPGLVQTMGLNKRTEPLTILGPEGSKEQLSKLLEIGYGNIPFEVTIRDLENWEEEQLEKYKVTACMVDHSVPTMAFRVDENPLRGKFNRKKAEELGIKPGPDFTTLTNGKTVTVGDRTILPDEVMGPPRKGRSFVYSGDTSPCDGIRKLAKDANVMIYESTFQEGMEEKALEYKHSTNLQAAKLAKELNIENIILDHISPRYSDEDVEEMTRQCSEHHPNVIIGSDLDEFMLTKEGLRRLNA